MEMAAARPPGQAGSATRARGGELRRGVELPAPAPNLRTPYYGCAPELLAGVHQRGPFRWSRPALLGGLERGDEGLPGSGGESSAPAARRAGVCRPEVSGRGHRRQQPWGGAPLPVAGRLWGRVG